LNVVITESAQVEGVLEIAVERTGDTGSISLKGALQEPDAERLEEHLLGLSGDETIRSLILDVKGLHTIDPAGLDVIRSAWVTAQKGLDAFLVRASSDVRFAFEQSGLDRVLPVVYECSAGADRW
jgi:anti-anti-sigma factor